MAAGGWGSLYAKLGNKFCQMSPRAADSETRLPPSTQKFGTRMKRLTTGVMQKVRIFRVIYVSGMGMSIVRPPGRVNLFRCIAHSEAKS